MKANSETSIPARDIPEVDVPTLAAIGVVSWVLISLVHEGIGHGGACLIVGGEPLAISTTDFSCGNLSEWQYKMVVASGSVTNLLAAAACLGLVWVRRTILASPHFRYFLWFFISTNLFHAGSYMLIGPFTGYGDWSHFVERFEPEIVWKVALTVLGYGICVIGIRVASLSLWQPLLGHEADERRYRMRLLTRVPFVVTLLVSVLAGLLSPLRWQGALFTSVLAPTVLFWLVNLPTWPRASQPSPPVPLKRSLPWLVAGVVFLVLFVGFLGPGIGSFVGYGGE